MRILVTGFEPFNDDPINPTQNLVWELRREVPAGIDLVTDVLPVDTVTALPQLMSLLERHRPDAVLLMGLAQHRSALSIERVAINLLDFNMPDNAGRRIQDEPIIPGGPAAYFTTLPSRAIVEKLRAAGIPVELSYTAGTYLCNQVLYTALHWAAEREPAPRVGFLHTPAMPAQVAQKSHPGSSMAFETMLEGVYHILSLLEPV